jgi:hypothetical protein
LPRSERSTRFSSNPPRALYLFDVSGRAESKKKLVEDIPRLVTEFRDAIGVGEFYTLSALSRYQRPRRNLGFERLLLAL